MDKHVNISITTGTILKVALIAAALWAVIYLKGLVLVVLTAIVIASAIEPLAAKFARHRIPRVLAVIFTYLLFFGSLFGIFYFFLPSVLTDMAAFVGQLPGYLDAFNHAGAFDEFAHTLGLQSLPELSSDVFLAPIREYLVGASTDALSAATHLFGGVLSFILVIVFSFYFTVAETGVDDFLRVIVPLKHQEYAVGLWKRAQHKIGLWMQGQLLLGVIMGVLVYLGLTIIGVKYALVFAVLAAICEIIPVFGPVLAAIPAVLVAFVDGGLGLGGLTIALYVIFQQFENHLIYPLVVTKIVGVPPLLVILALLAGAELAGFWGILLSVPVAAIIQELVRDLHKSRRSEAGK